MDQTCFTSTTLIQTYGSSSSFSLFRNFDDYCEFCKEALRTSGLAPKLEELRALFDLIDADDSKTLERHEILHAVMANWEVIQLLSRSKTLQPLSSVTQWKRAFEKLKQPDRRLAATQVLLRLSSDETCARAICEYGQSNNNDGSTLRPILHSLMPLLSISKGKEVAVNVGSIIGNLAWHYPIVKIEIPQQYMQHLWNNEQYVNTKEELGGIVVLLCDARLNENEKSKMLDTIHNFCYGKDGNVNKEQVIHHYYRVLRQMCLRLSESDVSLECRRSANGVICLLDLRKNHDQ